jgi:hypothetical protein
LRAGFSVFGDATSTHPALGHVPLASACCTPCGALLSSIFIRSNDSAETDEDALEQDGCGWNRAVGQPWEDVGAAGATMQRRNSL